MGKDEAKATQVADDMSAQLELFIGTLPKEEGMEVREAIAKHPGGAMVALMDLVKEAATARVLAKKRAAAPAETDEEEFVLETSSGEVAETAAGVESAPLTIGFATLMEEHTRLFHQGVVLRIEAFVSETAQHDPFPAFEASLRIKDDYLLLPSPGGKKMEARTQIEPLQDIDGIITRWFAAVETALPRRKK